jgi:hypothetical protein
MCRRAADTEEEAVARAEVLSKAGVVLRFNGMVYLRPQEVSELVYRVRAKQTTALQSAAKYLEVHPDAFFMTRPRHDPKKDMNTAVGATSWQKISLTH